MESARHAPFILSAYAVTFVVLGALILRAVLDHRAARRALERLAREDEA